MDDPDGLEQIMLGSMARILVLYNQPADPAAFDRYYFETHIPIANKLPGLRSCTVSSGNVGVLAGGQPPHLVAELEFGSMAELQNALASAEGQATSADLANFAQAGVTILAFDTRRV
jgi:uncharacterized protein (TIGR02118 family)